MARSLFNAVLFIILFCSIGNAVEKSKTFFLLPWPIQKEITMFDLLYTGPVYVQPTLNDLFYGYWVDPKLEKDWWNRYKFTINF